MGFFLELYRFISQIIGFIFRIGLWGVSSSCIIVMLLLNAYYTPEKLFWYAPLCLVAYLVGRRVFQR